MKKFLSEKGPRDSNLFDDRGSGCTDTIVEKECQSVVYRYESSMEKLYVGEFLARAFVTHCIFISQYAEYIKRPGNRLHLLPGLRIKNYAQRFVSNFALIWPREKCRSK